MTHWFAGRYKTFIVLQTQRSPNNQTSAKVHSQTNEISLATQSGCRCAVGMIIVFAFVAPRFLLLFMPLKVQSERSLVASSPP